MNGYVQIAIIFYLVYVKWENIYLFFEKQQDLARRNILAIGVLSAQENFDNRAALRETWLNEKSPGKDVSKSWFIVGKHFCAIPPEYRLNKYGCEKWKINSSALQQNFVTSKDIDRKPQKYSGLQVYNKGFSFQVTHPVVVKKLGILTKLISQDEITKVVLLDLQSKDTLLQAIIRRNNSYASHGYSYVHVDQILLPKECEVLLLAEGYQNRKADTSTAWNDGSVVSIDKIYRSHSHLDSFNFSPRYSVAASIDFYIPDIKQLKDIANKEENITKYWNKSLMDMEKKLNQEKEQHRDVLLVDVVDTYRNLPLKLLHFLKWLNESETFSYVLKTDDDSIIDLKNLHHRLKNTRLFNPSNHWIWSKFRKEWPLNHIGRWADNEYKSPIYPMFPCGSGYIISHETASWLSLNFEYLYPYQGEDVSMGIWLSAINPTFIEDEKWNCDAQCAKPKSFNAAELSVQELHQSWFSLQQCKDVCVCDHVINV